MTRALVAAAVGAMVCVGCVTVRPPDFMRPAPERVWDRTLADAQSLDAQGRAGEADSVLAAFATQFPGSHEAAETNYWRGVFRFDSSSTASVATATGLLQTYLTSPEPRAHDFEARALLRVGVLTRTLSTRMEQAAAQASAASAAATAAAARAADADQRASAAAESARASADIAKAHDETIEDLKKQLASANSELDRIKKRIAETTKKPPA